MVTRPIDEVRGIHQLVVYIEAALIVTTMGEGVAGDPVLPPPGRWVDARSPPVSSIATASIVG
jgi:hypothetical protein